MLKDKLDRPLKDVRISVTDRCNFRCFFCMPPDKEIEFLSRKEILSYEEITRVVSILTQLGVRKVRLTGGEPLVRTGLEDLIAMIGEVSAVEDIALTTNGYLLSKKAESLYEAGLRRITVSLFTLREDRFTAMSGRNIALRNVLEGIDRALVLGFSPIKVNTVVVRGVNDDEILDIAQFCRDRGLVLRFIEFMDVGTLNSWNPDKVVSMEEILDKIRERYSFSPLPTPPDSTAHKFIYNDIDLEFGVIPSVTKPFCRGCTRLRLSADGQLFTCLFSNQGHDLKKLLRNDSSDEDIKEYIKDIWLSRDDRYSELRREVKEHLPKVEMFRVGG